MRRIGYALFVLAGISVIIAVIALVYATGAPSGVRSRAVGYGVLNVGFAIVNTLLGFLLLMGSRAA